RTAEARSHRSALITTPGPLSGALELSSEVGPLSLADDTFNVEGRDQRNLNHDVTLSGKNLGVDRLYFDQTSLTFRIGIANHFSIGVPLTFGAAPMQDVPPSSIDPNRVRAHGDAAFLLSTAISPAYEINFKDSAIRFDAALVGSVIDVPTTYIGKDKHGHDVAADASTWQIAFEPRITVLPYVGRNVGAGFFVEANAAHPDEWASGLILQLRWGKAS
ncbi:MAG TPA: hypothetical protein VF407_25175, partial [Polyangiaceae bacterium]